MNALTTIKLLLLTPPSEGQGEAYKTQLKFPNGMRYKRAMQL